MINKLLEVLPHGSGIDYEYEIEHKNHKLYIHNAWHYIDDNGFYDGILPFTVVVTKDTLRVEFHVNNKGRYRVNKSGLKDYLVELFFFSIPHKIIEEI